MRFREHYRDYKYANNKSKFAQHVIEEGHAVGPINDIMDVIHIANTGRMLDKLEKFYVYRETQLGNQNNDKLTVQSSPIFEALIQKNPPRGNNYTRNQGELTGAYSTTKEIVPLQNYLEDRGKTDNKFSCTNIKWK